MLFRSLVAARQNVQELLSTLLTELPDCDVILNTVYDNKGGKNGFHNTWGPVWNQANANAARPTRNEAMPCFT